MTKFSLFFSAVSAKSHDHVFLL